MPHSGMTMPGRVVIVMEDDGVSPFHPGVYLRKWNHDDNGRLTEETFTRHKGQAMTFPTVGEALAFWRGISRTMPTRVDGKPNRPLTQFNITFESAEGDTWWNGLVNKTKNDKEKPPHA